MKFIKKIPENGNTKIVSFFAFLPITIYSYIGNSKETRWLERVTIKKRYAISMYENGYWYNEKFVT